MSLDIHLPAPWRWRARFSCFHRRGIFWLDLYRDSELASHLHDHDPETSTHTIWYVMSMSRNYLEQHNSAGLGFSVRSKAALGGRILALHGVSIVRLNSYYCGTSLDDEVNSVSEFRLRSVSRYYTTAPVINPSKTSFSYLEQIIEVIETDKGVRNRIHLSSSYRVPLSKSRTICPYSATSSKLFISKSPEHTKIQKH